MNHPCRSSLELRAQGLGARLRVHICLILRGLQRGRGAHLSSTCAVPAPVYGCWAFRCSGCSHSESLSSPPIAEEAQLFMASCGVHSFRFLTPLTVHTPRNRVTVHTPQNPLHSTHPLQPPSQHTPLAAPSTAQTDPLVPSSRYRRLRYPPNSRNRH